MTIEIPVIIDGVKVGQLDFTQDTWLDLLFCVRWNSGERFGAAYLRPVTVNEVLDYATSRWMQTGESYRRQRLAEMESFFKGAVSVGMTDEQLTAAKAAALAQINEFLGMAEVGTKPGSEPAPEPEQ